MNFAAVIERILGTTTRANKKRQRPAIIQTNAMLAAAELAGELLPTSISTLNISEKSSRSKKSVGGIDMANQSPTIQPKRNSFKRIATLSKILVGPSLQAQKSRKDPKWAEFTNKKNHQQKPPMPE